MAQEESGLGIEKEIGQDLVWTPEEGVRFLPVLTIIA